MDQEGGELSVKEAARLCGRNPETVRRWIWEGKLPARKLGNQLFIRRADLAGLTAHGRGPGVPSSRVREAAAVYRVERGEAGVRAMEKARRIKVLDAGSAADEEMRVLDLIDARREAIRERSGEIDPRAWLAAGRRSLP
jgi:excisionase family DNA binding protein